MSQRGCAEGEGAGEFHAPSWEGWNFASGFTPPPSPCSTSRAAGRYREKEGKGREANWEGRTQRRHFSFPALKRSCEHLRLSWEFSNESDGSDEYRKRIEQFFATRDSAAATDCFRFPI